MGSRQWNQDNPKVISYVPKTVRQRLQEFADEQDTSISKAVVFILEEYFELKLEQSPPSHVSEQDAKISNLEQKVEKLESAVRELTNQLSRGQPKEMESTQEDELPKFLRLKTSQKGAAPFDQTTSSEKTENYSQDQKSPSNYPSKPSQDSSIAEESIPISKTTRMRSGGRKSEENTRMNSSKTLSSSSNQSSRSKGQESSDNFLKTLGRLGSSLQRKLGDSNKESSSAPRRALPPSSDP